MSCDNEDVFAPLVRGDTRAIEIEFRDADDNIENPAGWRIVITFKSVITMTDLEAEGMEDYTVPNDANAALGIAIPKITPNSSDIEPGSYYFRVKRIIDGSPDDVLTLTDANQTIEIVP